LNLNNNSQIGDFGVSKHLGFWEDKMNEQCGTPAYIAPEVLKKKGYSGGGSDIWSSGVVLFALLYGTVPFKANSVQELHELIIAAKYKMKEDISPGKPY
jgi:5'-AMP-activated protein kinase catalytic alpha subunit